MKVRDEPIRVLVNFWEWPVAQIEPELDQLIQSAATHLTAFIPWVGFESDLSHKLNRFLEAVLDRRLHLQLIVTPEASMHFPNAGIPKEIIARSDCSARAQREIPAWVEPNAFAIPSFYSPDLMKRYVGYLGRLHGYLVGFVRNRPDAQKYLTLVVTSSFYKSYRDPMAEALAPFSSECGDQSRNVVPEFRRFMDDYYHQSEFSEPTPAALTVWKSATHEWINLRQFHHYSETVFRLRVAQILGKKGLNLPIQQVDWVNPEGDPAFYLAQMAYESTGQGVCPVEVDRYLDASLSRWNWLPSGSVAPWVHFSGGKAFGSKNDSAVHHWLLRSLLQAGGMGGGILMDHAFWKAQGRAFLRKTESLSRTIQLGDLRVAPRVFQLTAHAWSGGDADCQQIWKSLSGVDVSGSFLTGSLDRAILDSQTRMILVDPSVPLVRDRLVRLMKWVSSGDQRVLALPRLGLSTDGARSFLAGVTSGLTSVDANIGVPYSVYPMTGKSQLVLYDSTPAGQVSEWLSGWELFAQSMVHLARLKPVAQPSSKEIRVREYLFRDSATALVISHPQGAESSGAIHLSQPGYLSDLVAEVTQVSPPVIEAPEKYELSVPAFGLLPLVFLPRGEVNGFTIRPSEIQKPVSQSVESQASGME